MLLIIEGIVMCFALIIVCAVGIANGPVGLVLLYEKDVQERVVGLGLTTKEKIKRNFVICSIALFVPQFVLPPLMVYGINDVTDFWDAFWQMSIILTKIFDICSARGLHRRSVRRIFKMY